MRLSELQSLFRTFHFEPEQRHEYLFKLMEEVGELAEAIRTDKPKDETENGGDIKDTVAEELYDVLCYIVYLANAYDIDLTKAHQLKEQLNRIKYNR